MGGTYSINGRIEKNTSNSKGKKQLRISTFKWKDNIRMNLRAIGMKLWMESRGQ
jgi:hypothetical protein